MVNLYQAVLKPVLLILLELGFDPRKLVKVTKIPRFALDLVRFLKLGGRVSYLHPILGDTFDNAGSVAGHYFRQDLLVATYIYSANPDRHIDVGSRIDGFVAHVACFRSIEVMDVRPLQDIDIENIHFFRRDLTAPDFDLVDVADSVSCLHAIEHFGLGRYGDCVDPEGPVLGFNNLLKMLKPGGLLYISFPVGRKSQVYFNAQRVFRPSDLLAWPTNRASIEIVQFDFIDKAGRLFRNVDIVNLQFDLGGGCGVFTLRKVF